MKRRTFAVTRFDLERDGYYVDIVPGENGCVDAFLCNEDFDMDKRLYMYSIPLSLCSEDEWGNEILQGIDEYIKEFEESKSDNNYDVCDMIELHNNHADAMQKLAIAMIETYPDIEQTPVNDAFCEAFNSMGAEAVELCCEANEAAPRWATTESWNIVRD